MWSTHTTNVLVEGWKRVFHHAVPVLVAVFKRCYLRWVGVELGLVGPWFYEFIFRELSSRFGFGSFVHWELEGEHEAI
jgi:hypothetical protein